MMEKWKRLYIAPKIIVYALPQESLLAAVSVTPDASNSTNEHWRQDENIGETVVVGEQSFDSENFAPAKKQQGMWDDED